MRIDRTRTDTAKARAIALRNERRAASARRFLAFAFEDPAVMTAVAAIAASLPLCASL